MQIEASFAFWLQLLHRDAMCIGPDSLSDAGHLPGNLHIWLVRLNVELVVGDFTGNDGLSELADHGQLVAEVTIQSFEPLGQRYDGIPAGVGDDVAVIDVFMSGDSTKEWYRYLLAGSSG